MTNRSSEFPVDFSVDALIDDPLTHIIVCTGAGGVGKTTTAAAIAVRAAERGRTVCVMTIDPARRLAQALGLTELDNTPRPIDGITSGSLDAMMLDMKRTFDEVVESHADPARAQQILANPFYQALSSSFAGTQEYMAMEKLGQLHAEGTWDLIVVDTPPSRNALDFLDAPKRLGSFLDGRFIRILTAPARGAGRGIGRLAAMGFGIFTSVLNKVLGTQVLSDIGTFVAAIDTTFGGFRERAERTFELLKDRGTAFVVVATPEPDALREAQYFLERLRSEDMPLAGVVINRMESVDEAGLSADQAAAAAERLPADSLTSRLLTIHARKVRTAAEQHTRVRRFLASAPAVPVASVEAFPTDVHDLSGLRDVASELA